MRIFAALTVAEARESGLPVLALLRRLRTSSAAACRSPPDASNASVTWLG